MIIVWILYFLAKKAINHKMNMFNIKLRYFLMSNSPLFYENQLRLWDSFKISVIPSYSYLLMLQSIQWICLNCSFVWWLQSYLRYVLVFCSSLISLMMFLKFWHIPLPLDLSVFFLQVRWNWQSVFHDKESVDQIRKSFIHSEKMF